MMNGGQEFIPTQTALTFADMLYAEKVGSHIAWGNGFPVAFEGGADRQLARATARFGALGHRRLVAGLGLAPRRIFFLFLHGHVAAQSGSRGGRRRVRAADLHPGLQGAQAQAAVWPVYR